MADEVFTSDDSGENTMLNDAIEALRKNDRVRARDLLTRLLKTDQNNATYWVWLSAAVDTQKERLYCLQSAIQLDPENAAAKRGLALLGAIPPDDTVKPFPLNHPRLWEEQLVIQEEKKEKAGPSLKKPLLRLGMVMLIGVLVIGLVYVGLTNPHSPVAIPTSTRRPTRTVTPTITNTALVRTVTPTFLAPTPLW